METTADETLDDTPPAENPVDDSPLTQSFASIKASTPDLSLASASRDLFDSQQSRKCPPTSPGKSDKPEAKQRAVSDKVKSSPTIQGFLRALKLAGHERTKLMNTITGLQYYRARAIYFQYKHGNFDDWDLSSAVRRGLNDREQDTWGIEPHEAEVTAKTTEPKEEVELLKSLEADFTDDELVGAKINQRLANIASKRWGITLPNDKLKALLAKHAKPENCPDITTVRVNPEIWDQMKNFKRKADLRVSNIQQAFQKATFGILKVCDKLVDQQPSTDKETLASNIDAIVLLGHASGELSHLHREQITSALKAKFHLLCSQANESSSRSDLLFGADLTKQVRDAKDTNKIGKDIGVGKAGTTHFSRPYNSHHDEHRPCKKLWQTLLACKEQTAFFREGSEKTQLFEELN